MAQTATAARPQLAAPRRQQTLEAVRTISGNGAFDVDAWHVMEERDNVLIADEILHGAGSSSFVYNFDIKGTQVAGISVIGARHLAAHYRGLKHRLVGSYQKKGRVITFTAYPSENYPGSQSVSIVDELEADPDYYTALVEMQDLKTGNAIQVERQEMRFEYRRDGSEYERPNYATIAQSKAYRNAVLALIPQDIRIRWQEQMLQLQKTETITASVIDEKRGNVLRFAAQKALALDRRAVEELTLDQIAGLGDAAREGRLPAFVEAAKALGLDVAQEVAAETTQEPQERASRRRAPEPTATRAGPPAGRGAPERAAPSEDLPQAGLTPTSGGEEQRPRPSEDAAEPTATSGRAGQPSGASNDAPPAAGHTSEPSPGRSEPTPPKATKADTGETPTTAKATSPEAPKPTAKEPEASKPRRVNFEM
jgi:hypothetical protein